MSKLGGVRERAFVSLWSVLLFEFFEVAFFFLPGYFFGQERTHWTPYVGCFKALSNRQKVVLDN